MRRNRTGLVSVVTERMESLSDARAWTVRCGIMDFSLSQEQASLKGDASTFAATLNTDVERHDAERVFPRDKWGRCAEEGLLGLQVPRAYGGRGLGMLDAVLVMEGFGYGCRDNGLSFALNGQMLIQLPLVHFGSDEQKRDWLPGLTSGRSIGAFAFTEPQSGSDLYSLETLATRVEGGYRLTGKKALISYAPVARFALVFATTNPEQKAWGLTAFLVDLDTDGVQVGASQAKMGLRTVPSGEIEFRECLVPDDRVLGKVGAGLGILNRSIEWDRCCVLASQLGAMERVLEDSIAYAREREQFGQPIGKFQSVSNRVADMKCRLESSRWLLYKSAWMVDQGQPAMLDSAISKLALSEGLLESSLDAIRIQGGKGYLTDEGIERNLRDSVGGILYAGTSDIQRVTIARLLGL